MLDYFVRMRALLGDRSETVPAVAARRQRDVGLTVLDGYLETLANLGGRTGILVAKHVPRAQRP